MNKKFIHDSAFVENVQMAHESKIFKEVSIKNSFMSEYASIGDFSHVENSKIGKRSEIQRYSTIYDCEIGDYTYTGKNFTAWHAKIGKFCSISWNVSIGGANHNYKMISQHAFLYSPQFKIIKSQHEKKYERFGDHCEIGNDVWIACNAVILRNIRIGDGAVVAAGAVVTKDVEPYTIVAGAPAKIIKRRCEMDLANRLIQTCWWDFPSEIIEENVNLFAAHIDNNSVEQIEYLAKQIQNKQ